MAMPLPQMPMTGAFWLFYICARVAHCSRQRARSGTCPLADRARSWNAVAPCIGRRAERHCAYQRSWKAS